MSIALSLFVAVAALADDPSPRAIVGALGIDIGEVATNEALSRSGFAPEPNTGHWVRESAGHFPLVRVSRSLSGRVLSIVLERRWAEEDGLTACYGQQQALAEVLQAAQPRLVREDSGPRDIFFVRLSEPTASIEARLIYIICSHIPTRVPPTLRVAWRISAAERQAAYAEPPAPGSAPSSE